MTVTDICLFLIEALALLRGASRGFARSVIGPCALVIATGVAFLYYRATKDIGVSLAIGLLGPIALSLILKMILGSINASGRVKSGFFSRLAGAVITAAWVAVLTLPIIFVLTFLPPVHSSITALRKDIHRSFSYSLLTSFIPAEPAIGHADAVKDLREDQRMQALLNDPAIARALQRKDYAALLSNPKVMESAQDPQFIQKLLSAYQQITRTDQ
ncbi:MAG: CvpA family protein [Candidatus Omnitrophica bacterium]|nr:CvpA family protein [Candidatus Omnitrophota bacterium]